MKIRSGTENLFKSLWASWNNFWFENQNLKGLCLFRAILCWALALFYSIRHLGVELFYFDSGLMPLSDVPTFMPDFYRSLWPFYFHSDGANLWGHRLFILVLVLLGLGIGGRLLMWAALYLHVGFIQRNFSVVYGADMTACFWFLYLAMADSCKHYSVLNYWFKDKSRKREQKRSDIFSSIAVRLIQIQLVIIYVYTGCEKLKGMTWWEGVAVWKVLGNPQLAPFDMSFMAHVPWVIAIMTYGTLIFEVYFPVVVINKRCRNFWLSFGVFLHAGTAALMGLHFFALVMLCAYLVYFSDDEINIRRLGRLRGNACLD